MLYVGIPVVVVVVDVVLFVVLVVLVLGFWPVLLRVVVMIVLGMLVVEYQSSSLCVRKLALKLKPAKLPKIPE